MKQRSRRSPALRARAVGPVGLGLAMSACNMTVEPPPPPPPRVAACTPASTGLADAEPVSIPGVVLPPSCRISEDDSPVALFRRSVSSIANEAELQAACKLSDPAPIRGLVDFSRDQLLLVRIPDSTSPRWAVRTSSTITIGERPTECTGVEPKPIRYVVKVPLTSTTTFFVCAPLGCEEEP